MTVELEEVPDFYHGGEEDQLQGGEEGVAEDSKGVALDVVNILLILINHFIGIQYNVSAEQARKCGSKTKAEKSVEGLGENNEGGSNPEPLEEVLVWHVADKVSILCFCNSKVGGGEGEVEEVKGVQRN